MALFTSAAVRKEICMEQSVTQLKTLWVLHPLTSLACERFLVVRFFSTSTAYTFSTYNTQSQTRPWLSLVRTSPGWYRVILFPSFCHLQQLYIS